MDTDNTQDVRFSEWITKAFDLYKENILVLILAALIATLLSGISFGILTGPMMAGLALITLAISEGDGEKVEVGKLFEGFNFFLQSFLFCLVWGAIITLAFVILSLIVCVGQVAAIAGALAIGTLLMFAPLLIVDKRMAFWDASMASMNAVKPYFWPLLGYWLVGSILGSIGGIVCGIGSVVTAPIPLCMLVVAYRELGIGDLPLAPVDGPAAPAPTGDSPATEAAEVEVKAPEATSPDGGGASSDVDDRQSPRPSG